MFSLRSRAPQFVVDDGELFRSVHTGVKHLELFVFASMDLVPIRILTVLILIAGSRRTIQCNSLELAWLQMSSSSDFDSSPEPHPDPGYVCLRQDIRSRVRATEPVGEVVGLQI
jgi:hypothetical protein